MGFLRRLLGGSGADGGRDDTRGGAPGEEPRSAAELEAEERARERELLRADAERLSDELIQRQLRFADRSWTPPAQGGTRRSGDADEGGDGSAGA